MKYIFGDSFFSLSFLILNLESIDISSRSTILFRFARLKKKEKKRERERNVSRMTDEEVWRVANENVSASRVV